MLYTIKHVFKFAQHIDILLYVDLRLQLAFMLLANLFALLLKQQDLTSLTLQDLNAAGVVATVSTLGFDLSF